MCMQQNCIKLNNKNQNELVTSKKMNENNKPIFIRWKVGLLVIRDASFTISGPYSCLRIVRTSWNSISTSQSFKPESIFVSFKLQLESIFVWLCLTFPIRLFFFYFVWYVLRFLFWCSMFHHFQTKNFRLNAPNIQRFRTTTKPCCTVKEFHEPKTAKIANPISTKTKPTQNGCVIVCLKMRFLTREVCVWGMNPGVFRGFVSGYASRLSPQVQKENEGSVSGVRFRGKFRQNWTSQPYALSSTQRIQTIINTARL